MPSDDISGYTIHRVPDRLDNSDHAHSATPTPSTPTDPQTLQNKKLFNGQTSNYRVSFLALRVARDVSLILVYSAAA